MSKKHPINIPIDRDEKAKREGEASELEEMLKEFPSDITILSNDSIKILPKKIKKALDYEEITVAAELEATEIVKQNALFFFQENEIDNEPYIREKMKVDFITVSNLLFQMKTSEHAIIKLFELIDEGSGNIKHFEVLGKLQTSKMEIVKHLQAVMTMMEQNYKNLRDYYKQKESEGRVTIEGTATEVQIKKDTVRLSSGKDLIKSLRDIADSGI